ncbi:unnamed protein product [Amoebophrya sp. A25]|nr:unnamed protein product [Amoebophrya sp. A25]|eukprot:GSA25T00014947001.1
MFGSMKSSYSNTSTTLLTRSSRATSSRTQRFFPTRLTGVPRSVSFSTRTSAPSRSPICSRILSVLSETLAPVARSSIRKTSSPSTFLFSTNSTTSTSSTSGGGLLFLSPKKHIFFHHGFNKQTRKNYRIGIWGMHICIVTMSFPIWSVFIGINPDVQQAFFEYFQFTWTPPEADPSIIRDIQRGRTPTASSEESYEREYEIRKQLYANNPGSAADPNASYFRDTGIEKKVKWLPRRAKPEDTTSPSLEVDVQSLQLVPFAT